MGSIIAKLRRVLKSKFPGATTELDVDIVPPKKVGGYLIWDGFQDMEQLDRQRALSKALKEAMTADELERVTTILTITPGEAEAMREAAAAD